MCPPSPGDPSEVGEAISLGSKKTLMTRHASEKFEARCCFFSVFVSSALASLFSPLQTPRRGRSDARRGPRARRCRARGGCWDDPGRTRQGRGRGRRCAREGRLGIDDRRFERWRSARGAPGVPRAADASLVPRRGRGRARRRGRACRPRAPRERGRRGDGDGDGDAPKPCGARPGAGDVRPRVVSGGHAASFRGRENRPGSRRDGGARERRAAAAHGFLRGGVHRGVA